MNNRFRKTTVIDESNIEGLCMLAEAVMHALYMNYGSYDEEGNDIFDKYYWDEEREGDFESVRSKMHEELDAQMKLPENHLLYKLFRRGDEIGDVRYYTSEDILPLVQPILKKALLLFRKGVSNYGECDYVAASSVSDEFLTALFVREVRAMMMIFAVQKLHDDKEEAAVSKKTNSEEAL